MDERAARRAAVIAAILAIALFLAWWSTRGEHDGLGGGGEPSRARASDAGTPAAEGPTGVAPPKPRSAAATEAERAAATATYPWANEQPPPDYVGEPSDAGRPLPTKAPPPDYQPVDDEELDARRRETIDFLSGEIAELERSASHAEESGDSARAAALRGRRAQLEARRDTLRALVEP